MSQSWFAFALTLAYFLSPHAAAAAAAGPGCTARSAEVKLARECFTGDMRSDDEPSRFVGADETSPVGLGYCYNTFVVPYPVEAGRLTLLLIKDGARGQAEARSVALNVANFGKGPRVVAIKGLEARCFSVDPRRGVCSKGFFGYGSTDIPYALWLEPDARGYRVRGPVRDRARAEAPGTPVVQAPLTPAGPALEFLVGQVRTRLSARARQDLGRLRATPDVATRDELARLGPQFRYCRLAFEGLAKQLKKPETFSPDEVAVFDELDRRMIDPAAVAQPAPAVERATTSL